MTTFLYSQAIPDSFDNVSVNSNTIEHKDTATLTLATVSKPVSQEEFQLAAEVLQMAEFQHTSNATLLIRQTASAQYKKVSEDLNPATNTRKVRKKSLKDLMQQSFFHGAYWMGSNFIA